MDDTTQDRKQSDFAAVLTPHRSLGPTGFILFMILVVSISFVAGVFFYLIGAWPVMGFFGLDALLIYGAFKLNYRDARRLETIDLTGDELIVKRVSPSGRERRWEFHPYWARVEARDTGFGSRQLCIMSHGYELRLGHFLTDDEKLEFADALSQALQAYRKGGGARHW